MCVCVCVCVRACMHACAFVCEHVCVLYTVCVSSLWICVSRGMYFDVNLMYDIDSDMTD